MDDMTLVQSFKVGGTLCHALDAGSSGWTAGHVRIPPLWKRRATR
jgi:hypothetical protein